VFGDIVVLVSLFWHMQGFLVPCVPSLLVPVQLVSREYSRHWPRNKGLRVSYILIQIYCYFLHYFRL